MTYAIVVAVTAILMAAVVVSLNLTAGYAGQPNLAQSAFFGLGAYFAAVLSVEHGMSFWSVLPVAALVSGLAGAVLGAISLRLREDFFAITTVGLNFVVVALFKSVDFFGGAAGIYGLPLPVLGRTAFTNDHFLVLSLVVLAVVLLLRPVRPREVVFVVEPDQVPVLAGRLGVSSLSGLGQRSEPSTLPDRQLVSVGSASTGRSRAAIGPATPVDE